MANPDMDRKAQCGFSLLELMIALVIGAILASVAYPSYRSSALKGRRSDAMDAATAILQAEEQWRANNASYTASLASLSVASTTANGYYTLALSAASSTGYTLVFTPVAAKGQGSDAGCTAMSVVVTSGSPDFTPTSCWSR